MFPGMNDPKKMAAVMKQMGLKTEELDAKRVVVELGDGTSLVVHEPQVVQIEMQGQKSLQVSGKFSRGEAAGGGEAESDGIDTDVKFIIEQTGASQAEAKKTLDESGGNLAEAIIKLKSKKG